MNIPQAWTDSFNKLINEPFFWIVVGLLALVFLARIGFRYQHKIIHLFKSENGNIDVSRSALVDLIKKTCREVYPCKVPKVIIHVKRGKFDIQVKLKLYTKQHIGDVSSKFQAVLTEVLKEHLKLEKIGTINILITGFINSVPKSSSFRNDDCGTPHS